MEEETGEDRDLYLMYEDIIDNMKDPLKKEFPNLDIEFFQAGEGTPQSKVAAELDTLDNP